MFYPQQLPCSSLNSDGQRPNRCLGNVPANLNCSLSPKSHVLAEVDGPKRLSRREPLTSEMGMWRPKKSTRTLGLEPPHSHAGSRPSAGRWLLCACSSPGGLCDTETSVLRGTNLWPLPQTPPRALLCTCISRALKDCFSRFQDGREESVLCPVSWAPTRCLAPSERP